MISTGSGGRLLMLRCRAVLCARRARWNGRPDKVLLLEEWMQVYTEVGWREEGREDIWLLMNAGGDSGRLVETTMNDTSSRRFMLV